MGTIPGRPTDIVLIINEFGDIKYNFVNKRYAMKDITQQMKTDANDFYNTHRDNFEETRMDNERLKNSGYDLKVSGACRNKLYVAENIQVAFRLQP
jgi:hypothetical protein